MDTLELKAIAQPMLAQIFGIDILLSSESSVNSLEIMEMILS